MRNVLLLFILAFIANGSSYAQNPGINQLLQNDSEFNFEKILTNDPFIVSNIKDENTIEVEIMVNDFVFPYDISTDGKHVVISGFGSNSGYYWNLETGLQNIIGGSAQGISDNGVCAGTFDMMNGFETISVAGYWDPINNDWTFLGENPFHPNLGQFNEYNSGWDITADGQMMVGLQFNASYSGRAFTWDATEGYTDIGEETNPGNSSRASGVSKDGSVVYGWASPSGTWLAAVWYNNELHLMNNSIGGEANCSTPDGNYVAGSLNNGTCFIWNKEDGSIETLTNTLNNDEYYYTLGILDDKSTFGFTVDGFPPLPFDRRAFFRDSEGNMQSFNDYAESRGLQNAQDWLFYSVNASTPDGNIFIGSAENPQGQPVGFYFDFNTSETYELTLLAEPESYGTVDGGGTYEAGAEISISAVPNENYHHFEEWTDEEGNHVSYDAETTIIMPDEDYDLIAHFSSSVGVENTLTYSTSFYPNPTEGLINISSEIDFNLIKVFDIRGKEVFTHQQTNPRINLSGLESGIYYLKLFEDDELVLSNKLLLK